MLLRLSRPRRPDPPTPGGPLLPETSDCVHGHKAGKGGSGFEDCPDFCGGEWDLE